MKCVKIVGILYLQINKKEGIELKKLLLVIDMVNGFVKEGALADPYINNITSNVSKLIEEFKEKDYEIISIQEGHTKDSKEFESFPPHCILGTTEAELIDELKPYENDMKLIRKNSTCGFITEEFMKYFESNKDEIDEVVLCGCCTDICVLNFALPLKTYINEYNLPIKVTVIKNAVETYNSDIHNREEYNEMSFKIMKQNGIEIK